MTSSSIRLGPLAILGVPNAKYGLVVTTIACGQASCGGPALTNEQWGDLCSLASLSTTSHAAQLAEIQRLDGELERAKADLANAVYANQAFNIKVAGEINEARRQRDTLKRLLGEACEIAKQAYAHDGDHSATQRIAAIAKEAGL